MNSRGTFQPIGSLGNAISVTNSVVGRSNDPLYQPEEGQGRPENTESKTRLPLMHLNLVQGSSFASTIGASVVYS